MDGDLKTFIPDLAWRLGLGPRVSEALQAEGDRFQLVTRLAGLLVEGEVEPKELVAALGLYDIHPLSLVLALEDATSRPAAYLALGVRIPGVWRELLDLPGGADGPPPDGLTVPLGLELCGHPDLKELPTRLALDQGLMLMDLPSLRWLPVDLWCEDELRVVRCWDFQGWTRTWMGGDLLRRHLGVKEDRALRLWIQDCDSFRILPTHIDLPGMLDVTRCASFRKLPDWPLLFHLALTDTLHGVRRLKVKAASCSLELESLRDVEIIETAFSGPWQPTLSAVDLPKLRTIRRASRLSQVTVRACPALSSLTLGPDLMCMEGSDLPNLRYLRGTIPETGKITLSRCPRVRSLPKLPPSVAGLRLYDCPRLKRLPRLRGDTVRLVHAGPFPRYQAIASLHSIWDRSRREAFISARISTHPRDPFAWFHALEQAPSSFARVRILAEALRRNAAKHLLERAFADYQIHPISVLFVAHSPLDHHGLSERLTWLSPGLKDYLFDPGWPPTAFLPELPLSMAALSLSYLKVARSTSIENLALPKWPEGLEVEHDLVIKNVTQLPVLSEQLHVSGDLVLEDLPDLEAISDELTVEGRLIVRRTPRLELMPRVIHTLGSVVFEP